VQHGTLQCNTRWLLPHLVSDGRWDEAVEAARRRWAVALVVLHEGEVEPEPELVVEAPVQARDQLRVPRVAHLFDFEPHDTRTRGQHSAKRSHRPLITTPLTKQAEGAVVGRPRCAPGWRRRRGPPGALLSPGPGTPEPQPKGKARVRAADGGGEGGAVEEAE